MGDGFGENILIEICCMMNLHFATSDWFVFFLCVDNTCHTGDGWKLVDFELCYFPLSAMIIKRSFSNKISAPFTIPSEKLAQSQRLQFKITRHYHCIIARA